MIVNPKKLKTPHEGRHVNAKTSKESLHDIFHDLLKDVFWSENHLIKTLPKMAKASYNELLQNAFDGQLEQTGVQLIRLENCFELSGIKAEGKQCWAMEGLADEGLAMIENYHRGHARDAGLIAAAQKIEHYKISAYGTLRTMAEILLLMPCARLLDVSREEEVEADLKLTELALKINQLAADMEEEEAD
jgi:ferritin-like metal-binding protein YciE